MLLRRRLFRCSSNPINPGDIGMAFRFTSGIWASELSWVRPQRSDKFSAGTYAAILQRAFVAERDGMPRLSLPNSINPTGPSQTDFCGNENQEIFVNS